MTIGSYKFKAIVGGVNPAGAQRTSTVVINYGRYQLSMLSTRMPLKKCKTLMPRNMMDDTQVRLLNSAPWIAH